MPAPIKLTPGEIAQGTYGDVIAGTPPLPQGSIRLSPQDITQGDFLDEQGGTPGVAKTIALNATNLFGVAPALSGVIQHLVNNEDYAQARDRYQRLIDAANEENPISGYIGKGAALVGETVAGGGLGKLAGVAAKGIGLGARLAEAAPLTQAIVKGGLGGAAYGAAGGAGEALSHGQDILPAAAEGAGIGAVGGGVLGAAGHGLGRVLAGAEDRQVNSLVQDVSSGVLPRERKLASRLAGRSGIIGETEAEKAGITSADALIENRKAIRAAASANPAEAKAGINKVESVVNELEAAKEPHYAKLDEALGGGTDAAIPVDALENKASVLQGKDRQVLLDTAKLLREKYSTISTDKARDLFGLAPGMHNVDTLKGLRGGYEGARNKLEAFAESLPQGENWNKNRFIQHLRGSGLIENIDAGLREKIEELPFRFDTGQAKIPSRELRQVLTRAQEEASTALGTLNATQNARLADLPRQVVQGVVTRELDRAATTSVPGIAKTVQAIRDINTRQSTLLHIRKFAEAALEKKVLNKQGLTVAKGAAGLLGGYEALSAAKHLVTGNLGAAALDTAGAVLATRLPQATHFARTAGADRLGWLAREARLATEAHAAGQVPTEAGLKALKVLKHLQTVGQLASPIAGSLGAAASGTGADQ